jgi:hypothetical protein
VRIVAGFADCRGTGPEHQSVASIGPTRAVDSGPPATAIGFSTLRELLQRLTRRTYRQFDLMVLECNMIGQFFGACNLLSAYQSIR